MEGKVSVPVVNQPSRQKLLLLLGLVVVLGLGIVWYLNYGSRPYSVDMSKVKTGNPTAQKVSGKVNFAGILDADNKAMVSSQVSGVVSQVLVKEGDSVKQGQVLISLDKKDVQTQLDQAQLNVQKSQAATDQAKLAYDQAEVDYERNQKLLETGAISAKQFEQVTMQRDLTKSQYDTALNVGVPAAQEALQQTQLVMNKTDITSPIDAVVASCAVNPGDYINVNTGGPVLTLVAPKQITLLANAAEGIVSSLQPGQKATVAIDAFPGTTANGEISYISPVSIATGQYYPVRIVLQNPDGLFKPGMTAGAEIEITADYPVVVPKTALFRRDGQTYVYVIKEGKAVQTQVEVGLQGDQAAAVLKGLTVGDKIVTEGTDVIVNGMSLP